MATKTTPKKTKTAAKTTTKTIANKATPDKLNRLNLFLGFVLIIEAVAIAVISRGVTVPFTTSFLSTDTLASQAAGHTVWAPAMKHLFDIRLGYLVAACLAVAGIFRLLAATVYRKTYEADLKEEINKIGRFEYMIGGGLVLVTLAMVNGAYDISTLLAIFFFAAILGLFSLIVEAVKDVTAKHPRVARKLTVLAAFLPWVIIAIYLFGAQIYGDKSLPAYIYWLDGTMLVGAFIVGSIPAAQAKGKGKLADYNYAEKAFLVANFVLVSAFAWQIFFGTLR